MPQNLSQYDVTVKQILVRVDDSEETRWQVESDAFGEAARGKTVGKALEVFGEIVEEQSTE